jgi:glycosyltransferase involved in cell wall biosynthesis
MALGERRWINRQDESTMANRDVVSVVIPCFNQAHYLSEAIESVLRQTHGCLDIVVVDDGSTDQTSEVTHRYRSVRYIRQDNQGLSAARNTGLRASVAPYIVFLDADDRLLPNHLACSLRAFHDRPEAALVCGAFRYFGIYDMDRPHCCDPMPDYLGTLLRFNFIGAVHCAMFRTTIVIQAGGFSRELKACEDYDLYFRVLRIAPFYCHHELVAEYRRYPEQMTQQWDLMLGTALSVLHAQRPYIRGNERYEEAYRDGIRRFQAYYGNTMVWQIGSLVRLRAWRVVLRYLWALLRLYPQGFTMLLKHKSVTWWHRDGRRSVG